MKKLIFFTFLMLLYSIIEAQSYNAPLGKFYQTMYMKHIYDTVLHTTFKPLRINELPRNIFNQRQEYKSKFWQRIFNKNQVEIHKKNLNIYGNFLLDLYQGKIKDDTVELWKNTRGFQIYGSVGNNFSFYTDFYENQEAFLPYIYQKVQYTAVVPGRANWKDYSTNAKDFNYSSGYLSIDAASWLNIQLGQSKFFVGQGYRSLVLSDNSYSYPFLKLDFRYKHWQYITLMTEFQHFRGRYYAYHSKRHSTINIINYRSKNFELALIEGILWHTSDDSTYTKHFPPLFFFQLPFVREPFLINKEHYFLNAINFSFRSFKFFELYGQYVVDKKTFTRKQLFNAYQIGINFYNLFWSTSDKINSFISAEYNHIDPYVYFGTSPYDSWTNYNQPLAHTLGADFNEFVIRYELKLYNFLIDVKFVRILTDKDTAKVNFGNNLYLPINTEIVKFRTATKNKTQISHISLKTSYIVNYKYGLELFATYGQRIFFNQITQNKINFVFFGIKSNLSNFYYDF